MSRLRRLAAATAAAVAVLAAAPAPACAQPVTVFAAASLQTALDAIAAAWAARGGEARMTYASTSALARQIESGAPADVFISADRDWMDHLEARDLIRPETRRDLLGNRLVLIASGRDASPVALGPGLDLAGLLGPEGRLAVADTASVPAGRYARAALESLGAWEGVAARLAEAENVRAALAFVALGEAPFGIVYATDAGAEDAVSVVGVFPPDSHPPIVYPVALTVDAAPAAAEFLAFLVGPEARAAFEAEGFILPDPPRPAAG
jgi:molybdate transport system substrate-binding protein